MDQVRALIYLSQLPVIIKESNVAIADAKKNSGRNRTSRHLKNGARRLKKTQRMGFFSSLKSDRSLFETYCLIRCLTGLQSRGLVRVLIAIRSGNHGTLSIMQVVELFGYYYQFSLFFNHPQWVCRFTKNAWHNACIHQMSVFVRWSNRNFSWLWIQKRNRRTNQGVKEGWYED